jgi:hypothetical protein
MIQGSLLLNNELKKRLIAQNAYFELANVEIVSSLKTSVL